MANLGCKVTIVERHPVVHALLRDGLRRLDVGKDPMVSLRLVHADSMHYLPLIPESQKPDVIVRGWSLPRMMSGGLTSKVAVYRSDVSTA